jgi:sulfur-oxidizing protein SoxZ
MTDTVIRMPAQAKAGEVVTVRAMVRHPMESGFRHDNVGKPIPRHIVESFVCRYGGREVFRAQLSSGVTTNPYFQFYLRALETGDVNFTWVDDRGRVFEAVSRLEVI